MEINDNQSLIDESRQVDLDVARLDLLLKQSPLAIYTTLVLGLMMSILLWNESGYGFISSWFSIVVIIAVSRLFLSSHIKHKLIGHSASPPTRQSTKTYERLLSFGAFCNGLILGWLGLIIEPSWSIAMQLIIPLFIAGMAAGALSTNSSSLSSYYCFITPLLLLLSYGFYEHNMPFATLLVLVYLLMMAVTSKKINTVFIDSLNLKINNVSLINQLTENIEKQDDLLKSLRDSERLSSGAFNDAGVAMGLIDSQMHIFKVNQAACELLRYSTSELIGMNMLSLSHESDQAQSMRLFEELVAGKRHQYQLRKRYLTKEGSDVWVQATVSSVTNDAGTFEYAVVHAQDISQEHQLTQQLTYQAQHDALTGLPNRYAFEGELQVLFESKSNVETVLCYIDLDQFKVVNDTCGHIAGDELLRQISIILQQNLRKSDFLARIGGDEFAVLLFGCSIEAAKKQLSQLLLAIRSFIFEFEKQHFSIGASLGLVAIDNESSVTEILKQADSACYIAKDAGRDRLHVYSHDDELLTQRSGEMQWVSRIQKGLSKDRFILYSQQIVPTNKNDHVPHYELLIRMVSDDGDIIAPGLFLPAAERYNLAAAIDLWVVEYVINTLNTAIHEGKDIRGIYGINLSGVSLGDARFYDTIINLIRDNDFRDEHAYICFEITETAAITNMKSAMHFITELRAVGCQFALDDFGSGLSSFAYLKQMPVDYLKIDGMFVKDCLTDPVNLEMVDSINSIGHVMGLKTIAEYVEDDETFNKLSSIGVDYAQGYWNGPPTPWNI